MYSHTQFKNNNSRPSKQTQNTFLGQGMEFSPQYNPWQMMSAFLNATQNQQEAWNQQEMQTMQGNGQRWF